MDFNFVLRNLPALLDGAKLTVLVSGLAMVLALAWGIVVYLGRNSHRRALRALSDTYFEVMRNTPLLVQMYFVFFGSSLLGWRLTPFASGVLALSAQHGALLSEVYRAGVLAVSVRSRDGALALGMSHLQMMRLIVLPLALRKMIPAIGNQLVLLVKDSSLVSAIAVMDLTLVGRIISERSAASYETFVAVAFLYLVLTSIVGGLARLIEERLRVQE